MDLKIALQRAFEHREPTLTLPIVVDLDGQRRRVVIHATPTETEDRAPAQALVFFLDFLWLADGLLLAGWSTPSTGYVMLTNVVAAIVLTATGFFLLAGDRGAGAVPPPAGLPKAAQLFTLWCYFAAVCLIGMKFVFTWWWWFDGVWFWSQAFRPFADWGTGADLFGALLPAKWIGTRNLAFGLLASVALLAAITGRGTRFLGIVLLYGMMVEYFDGLWLATGKFNFGWSTVHTDFYMIGGFVWFPVQFTAGIFLLCRDSLVHRPPPERAA